MATETAVKPSALSIEEEEEEERQQETSLASSLARLQEVHIALRHLRDTIPRIVSTLHQQQLPPPSPSPPTTTNASAALAADLSPDDLYARFSAATLGAGNDIKRFTQLMREASTREILERAKTRKTEDTEGIEGWKVVEHEDWSEIKKEEEGNTAGVVSEEIALGEAEGGLENVKEGDVNKIVERFLEGPGKGLNCTVLEEGKKITVTLPQPTKLRFTIEASTTADSKLVYNVSCQGLPTNFGSLTSVIASRPRPGDLAFLLEMLSSYTDLSTRKCRKCDRVCDRTGKLPVVRNRSRKKQADGRYTNEWEALHLSCK